MRHRQQFAAAFMIMVGLMLGWSPAHGQLLERSGHATESATSGALSVGPDVTVIDLFGTQSYSSGEPCPPGYGSGSEDCRGYSIGTDSCNVGTYPVDWCDSTSGCRTTPSTWHPFGPAAVDDHSVIAQNLYRLKDGRFEQIGASFLKHGFLSVNSSDSACQWNDNGTPNSSCVSPPAGGQQLGLGCTDYYGPSLNGSRPMGRRSQVAVAGGEHPANAAGGETDDSYDQRIVVAESDLDPAQNSGAVYWAEGHYVVRDDARAGNGLNNASYREATIGSAPGLSLTLVGSTVRELPAIYAWQGEDAAVEIVHVDREVTFPGEETKAPLPPGTCYPDFTVTERFHAARRVTENVEGPFDYHYEYAIYNANAESDAWEFTVDLGGAAVIGNVGFHDVPMHSGEPFDTAEWVPTVDTANGTVTWSAVDMGASSNAIRWGRTYSFRFDSNLGPQPVEHRLTTLFDDVDLFVPFAGSTSTAAAPLNRGAGCANTEIFEDGFESGDTAAWSLTSP